MMNIVKTIIINRFLIFIIILALAKVSGGQTQPNFLDSVAAYVNIEKDLVDSLTLIPGTHAKLRLPKYFEPFATGKFDGFVHKGTSTSISGNEYPGTPYTALTATISDSVFIKQGAELLKVEHFDLGKGQKAIAYFIRFKTSTADVIRIMYFTGDYQTTYYLMANIPEVVVELIGNVVLASFKTLVY